MTTTEPREEKISSMPESVSDVTGEEGAKKRGTKGKMGKGATTTEQTETGFTGVEGTAVVPSRGSFVKLINDPETIKILADKTRGKIIQILSFGPDTGMTVPEIAKEMGMTPPSLYHHIDLLFDHGLLNEHSVKQKRRSVTRYSRSSPVFLLFHIDKPAECSGQTLDMIQKTWDFEVPADKKEEILAAFMRIEKKYVGVLETLVTRMQRGVSRDQIMPLLDKTVDLILFRDEEYRKDCQIVSDVIAEMMPWAL